MVTSRVLQFGESLASSIALGNPLVGKLATANFFEDLAHLVLGGRVDDARTARHVAVLRGVRNRVAHASDAFFVHQVDDQLHFVQALEIRHLWLITGLDESFVSSHHERGEATTQHHLLTEEIGFRLLWEGGLDDARTGTTNAVGIGQGKRLGIAGCILMHGNQRGHTAAFLEGAAHEVTRALRGDHDHVHVLRRLDAVEANVEAVRESERLALRQMSLDRLFVDLLLLGVGSEQHDDICPLRGIGDRHHLQALGFGLGLRR